MGLRNRKSNDAERVPTVNRLANNFGQTLLTLCDGDWDLALSVSLTLFASTCAQAAVEHEESAEELFDEVGPSARAAVLTFETQFIADELAARMAARMAAGKGGEDETG